MRPLARKVFLVLAISLVILVGDFFTLENRLVTTNPALQKAGGLIAIPAAVGLVAALILLALGQAKKLVNGRGRAEPGRREPADKVVDDREVEHASRGRAVRGLGVVRPRMRFRPLKVLAGLAILASWLVVLPVMVHAHLIVPASDYSPGPWAAETFLSLFAVGVQFAAPTPLALAFWPSMLISAYFLFGRRDRPVVDLVAGIAGAALVWLLFGVLAP